MGEYAKAELVLNRALKRKQDSPETLYLLAQTYADQALGRSKGRFGTKRHLAVDGLGNPVEWILTGGQEADPYGETSNQNEQ